MMNRIVRIAWLSAVVMGGASLQSVLAAGDPKVLGQTAEVVIIDESCHDDCPFAPPHDHGLADLWHLKKGSTFEVNHRVFDSKKLFFDLSWDTTSEMQDPDPLLVWNANPLSTLNFSYQNGTIKISDFLFLFTIHDLVNPGGQPPSPHALIYIPYRTTDQPNPALGNFYRFFVIHIPDTDGGCDAQRLGVEKRLCHALRRLATKWKSGDYTQQGLAKETSREAREFLDHLFDEQPKSPDQSGPVVLNGDPIDLVFEAFVGVELHNGVIHGTLGGG